MRYLAVAVVAIMVASAFVAVSPSLSKSPKGVSAPDEEQSAEIEIGGTRSIKYEMFDVGESYLKPTDYSKLGRHDHSQSGINSWFPVRNTNYNDTVIHSSYPYVVSYDPYSGSLSTSQPKYNKASWTTHSFYTLKIDAENITSLATGTGAGAADPMLLPIMEPGGETLAGGWVNMSMYFTYLTTQEFADIATTGNHYANTVYGVVPSDFNTFWYKPYADDGWLMEAQGHFDFNRLAAMKFLGLAGSANLINDFNARGAAAIAADWRQEWINDSDAGKPLDILCAYDYSLFSGNGPVYVVVKLDAAASTPSKLAIWFWSCTWGAEAMFMSRLMWATGITEELQPYMEDWYLNGTFAPTMGDLNSKMTTAYHMTMWKDPDFWNPAWIIEPQNMDYTADNGGDPYVSYFDSYFCSYYGNTYKPLRKNWIPGQRYWGTDVHFWTSPMTWNLDQYESLTVKLPLNKQGWGIRPYLSLNNTTGPNQLPGNSAAEQYENGVWGEWMLGHGYPSADIYSLTYYNPTTKTLSWTGPKSFARNLDVGTPSYPNAPYYVNESGSPFVVIDIGRVSQYNLTLQGNPSPIYAQQTYTLQVKPLNYTGAQAYCNQTVVLPVIAGVTYGATSHTFAWNETIWNTTVIFSGPGTYNLASGDQYFYLDVSDLYTFIVDGVIPEFPTLLIPVIGAAAIFVAIRRRKSAVQ